jgi:hypothetical protein
MAVSIIQNWNTPNYNGDSNSAAPASPITAGSTIRLFIYATGGTPVSGSPNFTVTATGLTFVFVGNVFAGGTQIECELYYAANVPSSTPTVSVTGTQGQDYVLFIASELGGVSTSAPFVQFTTANNVFVPQLSAGPITTAAGNLLVGAANDSFGGLVEGAFSAGSTNTGIEGGYGGNSAWSGDWQVSGGGAVSYTDNGSGGYAAVFIDEWAAAGGSAPPPSNVIFNSMDF